MTSKDSLIEKFGQGKRPTGADFTDLINGLTRRKEVFTATSNQTVFTLKNKYSPNEYKLSVVVGGVPQFSPENFTETSATKFTMKEGLSTGTEVVVIYSE